MIPYRPAERSLLERVAMVLLGVILPWLPVYLLMLLGFGLLVVLWSAGEPGLFATLLLLLIVLGACILAAHFHREPR